MADEDRVVEVGVQSAVVLMDKNVVEVQLSVEVQPRCSISQFIRRMAFTIYHAAFFLEGRQSQVGICL